MKNYFKDWSHSTTLYPCKFGSNHPTSSGNILLTQESVTLARSTSKQYVGLLSPSPSVWDHKLNTQARIFLLVDLRTSYCNFPK